MPGSTKPGEKLPDYFVSSEDISPREHVDIQAASQKWIDSSISKTANVPTDYPYEKFKDIYLYAHEKGLKGCTTFRFNPEAFQGVLVKEKDLKNTTYRFTLADGSVDRGQRRRGDRVRRRDAHGRESLRRPQRGLLRQALTSRRRDERRKMAKITIDKKIVKFAVAKDEAERSRRPTPSASATNRTSSGCTRSSSVPEVLIGSTYKVKTPVSDHAMYVTINDIVLNEGTQHEQRRPFEIFINSKNLDHYQWIVALTRIMSAVFRKGGDVTFLVDELKAVFDPRGGYWQPGGKFMPSIIAELGHIVEKHLVEIGLLKRPGLERRAEASSCEEEARRVRGARGSQKDAFANRQFPEGAQLCTKCNTAAAVMLDGCMTCLNCGYSKCG